LAVHLRTWEFHCVPLSCGYAPVYIGLCGLVASLSLTAR
jgi:hypothetical protein